MKSKKFLFTPPNVESGAEEESKLADFKRGRKIGSGAFGSVFEVTHKKSKKVFAMKEMSKRFIEEHDMLDNVVLEAKVMYSINHPNIVRIITHFEDKSNVYLILEKVENGSIDDLLKKRRKLPIRLAVEILYQLVTAIEFLHSMPHAVIHRDLKPANILLTKDNMVKIADFGWASVLQNKSTTMTVAGTYQYLAPEIIEQKGYSTPVDVWMLGVIFYEMICGKTPFEPKRVGPMDNFLTPLVQNIRYKKPQFTSDFNTSSKKLLMKLLEKRPQKRIKINQIKKDNLFKKYDLKKFDEFSRMELPKNILNNKTNKEWYVSIRQVRAELLMSLTTQNEAKNSKFKGVGYMFGKRLGTMRRKQKPEVVAGQQSPEAVKGRTGSPSKQTGLSESKVKAQADDMLSQDQSPREPSEVQRILRSGMRDEQKIKLIASQVSNWEDYEDKLIEDENFKIKPRNVRVTIPIEEPLDNEITRYFEEHSEYEVDAKGNIILKRMRQELDNANEKVKNLENYTSEVKKQGETAKRENEALREEVSGLEKQLVEQKQAQSKESEERIEALEKSVRALKEENLSIKMGKFKLKDILYNDLKETLVAKQEQMIESLEVLNMQFKSGVESQSQYNALFKKILEKNKDESAVFKQRSQINLKLSSEITEQTKELIQLRDTIRNQQKVIEGLQDRLKDKMMIQQYAGYLSDED